MKLLNYFFTIFIITNLVIFGMVWLIIIGNRIGLAFFG